MNIIELLMVEHASLRLHFRFMREKSSDLIYEAEDFVRNCHAKVEDELVFPRLNQILATKEVDLVKALSRIEADHKLIEKIGDQIKNSTAQADTATLKKRIMLYANTVESHNSSEESLIFQHWQASEAESREIMSKAKEVIEQFGRDRYFRITGISERLFDKV